MGITRTRKIIDCAGAASVLGAAARVARDKGHRVAIAVVDPWGDVIGVRRVGAAPFARTDRAIDRARTSGIPLTIEGEVVGAIGTSGDTPDAERAVSLAGAQAPSSYIELPVIGIDGARTAADAAGALGVFLGAAPVVAVVDPGGELVYQWRPDCAPPTSVRSAVHRARTAPQPGGVPLRMHGHVIGAIGVSGTGSDEQDDELAHAGLDALRLASEQTPGDATVIPASVVRRRQDAGGGLLLDNPRYRIGAVPTSRSGDVQHHDDATDIIVVLDGSGTVITAGCLRVDERPDRVGDTATTLDGGRSRALAAGDILIVPEGMPYRFVAVTDGFRSVTVKVTA